MTQGAALGYEATLEALVAMVGRTVAVSLTSVHGELIATATGRLGGGDDQRAVFAAVARRPDEDEVVALTCSPDGTSPAPFASPAACSWRHHGSATC